MRGFVSFVTFEDDDYKKFIQVNVKVVDNEGITLWARDNYDIEEGDDVASILERMAEYLDKEAYNDNPMLLNLLEEDFKLVADKPDDYKPTAGEYILLTFEKPIKKKDEEQNKDRPVCLVTRDGMTIYHGKNLNPDILLPGDKIFTVIGDVTFIRKEEEDDDEKEEDTSGTL